jgi:hypothetical protein
MFRYENNQLINEKGKIVTITGKLYDADREGRNIGLTTDKKRDIQSQFDIVYVKDMPRDLKKGEMNKDFGFKIGTDFYIESQLSSKRYLDIVGSYDVVIKTPNSYNSQKWFFDNKTKTLKSRKSTSYSLEITNAGRNQLARIYSTYGYWY